MFVCMYVCSMVVGIERISKALLSISSSGFDFSDLLVKTLVNCSRYSWMRLRIIEDGSRLIPSYHTYIYIHTSYIHDWCVLFICMYVSKYTICSLSACTHGFI